MLAQPVPGSASEQFPTRSENEARYEPHVPRIAGKVLVVSVESRTARNEEVARNAVCPERPRDSPQRTARD